MIIMEALKSHETTFDRAKFLAMTEGEDVVVMNRDHRGVRHTVYTITKHGDLLEVTAPPLRANLLERLDRQHIDVFLGLRTTRQIGNRILALHDMSRLVEWARQSVKES